MAYLSERTRGGGAKSKCENKLNNMRKGAKIKTSYVQGEASIPPKTASRADIRPRPK